MGGGDGLWVRYILEEYDGERREMQGGLECDWCQVRRGVWCRDRPRDVLSGARGSTECGSMRDI